MIERATADSMNRCHYPGCENPVAVRGLCKEHYLKFQKDKPRHAVYAIHADMNPPRVKFGCSTDVQARFRAVNTDSPADVRLMGRIFGSYSLEGLIHKALDKYRVRGEWFEYRGEAEAMALAIEAEDKGAIEDILIEHIGRLGVDCEDVKALLTNTLFCLPVS